MMAKEENTKDNPHIQTWLDHIHALAEEIGPRGPTTEGERQGHRYCQEIFDGDLLFGLD